jgi:hypothetical protein
MPEPGITLDHDQAADLRELITLTAIVQEWLQYADDGIPDDLAGFAYRSTARPRSYAAWLTEDLAALSGRLRQAVTRPQPAQTKIKSQRRQGHRRQPSQDQQITPANGLDTAAPIGNQIPSAPPRTAGQSHDSGSR